MDETNGTNKPSLPAGTYAVYMRSGPIHGVIFRDIHVLILNEDGVWIAQGLEIDYTAQGVSFEDVKRRFEKGLKLTLTENLKAHGTIEGVFNVAPKECWDKYREQVDKWKHTFADVIIVPVPQEKIPTPDEIVRLADDATIATERPEAFDLKVEYSPVAPFVGAGA